MGEKIPEKYDHRMVEPKWEKRWEEAGIYQAVDSAKPKPKKYVLFEFPYPSGERLHIGHAFAFTGTDVLAHFYRMKGFNVLCPMGWDAFGLPAENYAVKTGVNPMITTAENIANSKVQAKRWGLSVDWDREISTTDPKYYKWTQWIFLQWYKKGLAYKEEMPINWCPKCKIGLANEEVVVGNCERCGTETTRRNIKQWIVKITAYADRLIEGLEKTAFIEKVKAAQINWIGRSEGAKVEFQIKSSSRLTESKKEENRLGSFEINDKVRQMLVTVEEVHKELLKEGIKVWFNGTFGVVGYYGKFFDEPADVDCGVLEKDFEKAKKIIENLGYKNIENKNNGKFKVSSYKVNDYNLEIGTFDHDLKGIEADIYHTKYYVPDAKWLAECYRITAPKERRQGKNDLQRALFLESIETNLQSKLEDNKLNFIEVFTTRLDTLYGATFMVVAPEHWLVREVGEVGEYVEKARKKSDLERTELAKEKTGVFSGLYAINPATRKEIPIWISDFVLSSYGTGAIMAVPAHDERDWQFAKKFGLPIVPVIVPEGEKWDFEKGAYTEVEKGITTNSPEWNGLVPSEAIKKATEWIEKNNLGKKAVSYHLRDWIFSRQHYWGEPIPIIYCEKCGEVPVPEDQLPVELPKVENYKPTDTGESPLAAVPEWVNTTCPECGGPAKRETDTMPNWAGSDWYFLRYIDPDNDKVLVDLAKAKYWLPVDIYVGGDEHNTLHLLYSRFTYQFLWDIGAVPKGITEPYYKRLSHGVILGPDGQRMSKSRGNVINPDEIIEAFGADSLRLYLMFMGPFDYTMAWSQESLEGCCRFLKRVWNLVSGWENEEKESKKGDRGLERKLNQTIKKVGEDVDKMKFNTAVAAMMELLNEMTSESGSGKWEKGKETLEKFLLILAPFAPHVAEELWERLGNKFSVHQQAWPEYDPILIEEEIKIIAIQINGKLRGTMEIGSGKGEMKEEAERLAKENEKVKKYLEGKEIKRTIYVPGKLVNFVMM